MRKVFSVFASIAFASLALGFSSCPDPAGGVDPVITPRTIDAVDVTVAQPVADDAPQTSASDEGWTASIAWASPAGAHSGPFAPDTVYTAAITLAANTGYRFSPETTLALNGAPAPDPTRSETSIAFSHAFPATEKLPIAAAALSVAAPAMGMEPQLAAGGPGWTASIAWASEAGPHTGLFAAGTVYTATITLTAGATYRFTDETALTLNDEPAPTEERNETSVTLKHEFDATGTAPPVAIDAAAITAKAPADGAMPQATAQIESGENFYVANVAWASAGAGWEPEKNAFVEGAEYSLHITLAPNAGFYFAPGFSATINGAPTQAAQADGGRVTLSASMTAVASALRLSVVGGASLAANARHSFDPASAGGYTARTVTITVANDGGETLSGLRASLSGEGMAAFEFANASEEIGDLTPGGSKQLVLRTKTGMALGEYVARITVADASGGTSRSFDAAFSVLAAIPGPAALVVAAPAIGAQPSTAASITSGANFTVTQVAWLTVDGSGNPGAPLTGAFVSGGRYAARITLAPNAGHAFADNFTATINGGQATVTQNGAARTITSAPLTTPTAISGAAAFALEPPVAGATPGNAPGMVTLPPGANFAVTEARWLTAAGNNPVTGPFQPGQSYVARITLTANSGYAFTTGFSATVNSQPAQVTQNGAARTITSAPFTALTAISGSALLTLEPPLIGVTPSNTPGMAIVLDGSNFAVTEARWFTAAGNSPGAPVTGAFQPGQSYVAQVTLTANSGYAFAPAFPAIINGQTATVTQNGAARTITSAPFTALAAISGTAAFTIAPPVAGVTPSNTPDIASAPTGANFTVVSATWYEADNWGIPVEGPFQAGQRYAVELFITANAGYAFALDFAATINGQSAETLTNGIDRILISVAYTPAAPTAISVAMPHVGFLPKNDISAAAVESAGGDFTVVGVEWQVVNEDHLLSFDGPFQADKLYVFFIGLEPNPGYSFPDDFSATINGQPARVERIPGHPILTLASVEYTPDPPLSFMDDWGTAIPSGGTLAFQAVTEGDYQGDSRQIFVFNISDKTIADLRADLSPLSGPEDLFFLGRSENLSSLTPGMNVSFDLNVRLMNPIPAGTHSARITLSNAEILLGFTVSITVNPIPTISSVNLILERPVVGGTPQTTLSGDGWTGGVSWLPTPHATMGFLPMTNYRASITLTATGDARFTNRTVIQLNGIELFMLFTISDGGQMLDFTQVFPQTGKATLSLGRYAPDEFSGKSGAVTPLDGERTAMLFLALGPFFHLDAASSVYLQPVNASGSTFTIQAPGGVWHAETRSVRFTVTVTLSSVSQAADPHIRAGVYFSPDFRDSYEAPANQDFAVKTIDGRAADRPIPVNQDNYAAFHAYANTFTGRASHYLLVEDINHATINPPIAGPISSAANFTGTFDGGGHTISNIAIGPSGNIVGLFAEISGANAAVRNLRVSGSVTGGSLVGGIAGVLSNGATLENVHFTGSVTATGDFGGGAGGLVGQLASGTNYSRIRGSSAAGAVRGTGTTTSFIGGLVGRAEGVGSTISDSHASGEVEGQDNVGGIFGGAQDNNAVTVERAFFTGTVTAPSNAGGIIGRASATSTVRNAVALSVDLARASGASTTFGRIVGHTNGATVQGSYATADGTLPTGSLTGNHGTEMELDETQEQAWWEALGFGFRADDRWVWDGALKRPVLR